MSHHEREFEDKIGCWLLVVAAAFFILGFVVGFVIARL